MKRILLVYFQVLILLIGLSSCKSGDSGQDIPAGVVNNPNTASGKADKDALPVLSFEKDFHDFGKLQTGEKVTYSFKFKNTGNSMLVISTVTTSCGCTVSDYPKQPIKPGEDGTVDVSFDSEGRHGIQNKSITVFSNTQPPTTQLSIKALVIEPEE
ncbi:MAG: DUF1573 domain-containing protein [Bacteroidales bacterium]|nr:DUF1573 domain-containing protein [Bacteroidales bacterium]MBK7171680.1 DUF1573 domain-containing protein [Bacteroidales bacterium]